MNINKLNLKNKKYGNGRINEIMSMPLLSQNLMPKAITYIDIDTKMTEFVSKQFDIVSNGEEIKTFFLAQQRMSEFTKTWEMLDENKNVLPNFKIVTRENNPKPGTLLDGAYNIPGEPYFTIGTFDKWSGGHKITVSYKMKQPYCVDITYNIKFITNKLTLLNELNNKIIDNFKSRQNYVIVNGHYMPVILEDVSDESSYELDERKIFVQNYQLILKGYIINENDIIVEENLVRNLVGTEFNINKPNINTSNTQNIEIIFPRKSKNYITFKSNIDCNITNITFDSNIESCDVYVNGIIINGNFEMKQFDNIKIKINRVSLTEKSIVNLIKE